MEFKPIAEKITENNNGVQKFQYQMENHIGIAMDSNSFQAISNWKIEQTKKFAKRYFGNNKLRKIRVIETH